MKRLIVMRHAKSSWKAGVASDHERPLNERGRLAAPAVGARLAQLGWLPERVLSSDSARTRETWSLLSPLLGRPPVQFLPELYLGGTQEALQTIASVPEELGTVLVLGHNPGWEMLVGHLTSQRVVFKTADCALLSYAGQAGWAATLEPAGQWSLAEMLRARALV